MDLQLRGKTVLITGASQGIGEGLAEVFAEEGCRLHLVARSAAKLSALASRLTKTHGIAVTVQEQDIAAAGAADAIAAAAGSVDVLVNNAGAIPGGDLWEVDAERWRTGWEVKVLGYIDLCRAFYAKMKAAGGGVILNNIGNGGENFDFRYIAGSTGNAALMAFTRALGGRSLEDGIRVLGINPGPVATDRIFNILKKRAREQWNDESRYTELLAAYPLGRAASVREVADLFAFLASPRSAYTSGTIMTIDGGLTSRRSI
ncbi:NAD(P)-dependent dehydrogenase (short-subunit alcohol dehydrogenase family) [Xanthobacter flavus]|uniref:NAD(P)-dependent dehydrogenase (Short-subunit alcohol dehydrogenase family) n=1 Tax=Xanthobacter flavus TaxID=281 RepID=A0A9W6FKT2_XANFL|nr:MULTISPECIES: SDR family oxidoreductase [Xanthobacter]MDR6335120.1 NAD(P)-dependent dehydrogenase (short-subunit alcohol dehydrogenase family) [Xanthobacter flavus]UDQ89947.1 SDR family oxidoreductase [Xanthobacter autotrophicus]GLI23656.1 short-chain dehydrogenase/reductase [Xanthobacter flavus]